MDLNLNIALFAGGIDVKPSPSPASPGEPGVRGGQSPVFQQTLDRESTKSDQPGGHDRDHQPQPDSVMLLDTQMMRALTVEKNDTVDSHINVPAWMGPLFETLEAWRDTQTSATAMISLDNPPMKLKVRLEGHGVDLTFYTPDPSVLTHGTAVAQALHRLGLVLSSVSQREPYVERHGNSQPSSDRREHRRAARKERAR